MVAFHQLKEDVFILNFDLYVNLGLNIIIPVEGGAPKLKCLEDFHYQGSSCYVALVRTMSTSRSEAILVLSSARSASWSFGFTGISEE